MFDSYVHKLGAHDAETPFTPAVQQARVEHNGATYVLTLVRSLVTDLGSALLERNPYTPHLGVAQPFLQHGNWEIRRHDEGPTVLELDFDDSGDIDGFYELLDKLASALTSRPDSWAESFQPLGGF